MDVIESDATGEGGRVEMNGMQSQTELMYEYKYTELMFTNGGGGNFYMNTHRHTLQVVCDRH